MFNEKKLEFIADTEETYLHYPYPEPAKKLIPNWYKLQNRYTFGDKTAGINKTSTGPNTTVKACMPFQDALTMGYILSLPCDIEVRNINGLYQIKWDGYNNLITEHNKNQVDSFPKPDNVLENQVFKFIFDFVYKSPNGYSLFFTHPINRYDLPFRTFSGLVDCDIYDLPVNFPFQITKSLDENDILIIEKGTPIAQIIPIKKENWTHIKKVNNDPKDRQKRFRKLQGKIVNSYKSQYWNKKSYQ